MPRSRPGEIQETHAATSVNLGPATSMQMLRSRPGEVQTISATFVMDTYISFQLILVSTSTAQLIASQDIRSTQPRL